MIKGKTLIWSIPEITLMPSLRLCRQTFGNQIRVRFTLDQNSAVIENIDMHSKIVNRAAAVIRTLGFKPGTAGAIA